MKIPSSENVEVGALFNCLSGEKLQDKLCSREEVASNTIIAEKPYTSFKITYTDNCQVTKPIIKGNLGVNQIVQASVGMECAIEQNARIPPQKLAVTCSATTQLVTLDTNKIEATQIPCLATHWVEKVMFGNEFFFKTECKFSETRGIFQSLKSFIVGKAKTAEVTLTASGDILPESTIEEAKRIVGKVAECVTLKKAVPKIAYTSVPSLSSPKSQSSQCPSLAWHPRLQKS